MALDAFTTVVKTRADAGFANNANVLDATIQLYVDASNGEMATALAARYTVPLSGNSNYSGSLTEDYLENLATTLASGLLLLRQYEGQGGDMEDLAIAKIESARAQLKEIQRGTRALIGTDGAELDLRNSALNAIEGFPLSSTDNPSIYDMGDKF